MTAMLPPLSTAPSMPVSTAESASTGSPFHAAANSSALMPAVSAHVARPSEPVATSLSIWLMMVEMAVPPASALMPMDVSAVDRPRMSASLMPTWWPAAATLMAMSETADSVVAKLLPRATMVEP